MGENNTNNDQQLGAGNNNECSNVIGTSSSSNCASTMIKIEETPSSHTYPSHNVNSSSHEMQQSQSVQQSQDSSFILPPSSASSSCTGSITGANSSSTNSSLSSSSSASIGPSVNQSFVQPGVNQTMYINHSYHPSGMDSTLNSSISSLDRRSPSTPNLNINNNACNGADYLAQLLKDRKQLSAFPNVFHHVERLLEDEISKIRGNLFQVNGNEKRSMVLPEPEGQVLLRTEKVYVPVKDFPDYNFVGRILGPRGMTAKQLEQETGCKIMVRGRGSMRDKKKEEMNRGKPNWEHLSDELHVLITCEDTPNRAEVKLERAKEEIRKLLVPVTDGDDDLKKRQLMELAILNGTYRDPSAKLEKEPEYPKFLSIPGMRPQSVASLGSPLMIAPPNGIMRGLMTPDGLQSFMNSADGHHPLVYNPYFAQYPMGHLFATEFASSPGQGMDSLTSEDKRKKRRLN